jgi:NAD(P)-dependent dehydrogenase (short-subunit alcohol dehydrogenase family)
MAWTTADIPDQSRRVAVVTGANGGLGLEVARELARKGGHIVMAARDQAKAEAARASIRGEIPDASLELQPLDLASLASVGEAAGRILADHPRIDLLVNNAGVMGIPERRTEDGFEMQLAVNHLGHFALTAQLLPALLQSIGARVVSVTSTGRHTGRALDPDNPHLSGSYDPWRAYGQSKLANVHFALELFRRFRAAGVPARSIVVHPGFTNTDLQARSVRETGGGRSQRFFHAAVRRVGMTPAQGGPHPASSGHRPGRCWRRPLHAALGELGRARAPADVRSLPKPGRHGHPLGGLRARDRDHVRHQAAAVTPGDDTRPPLQNIVLWRVCERRCARR